MENEFTHNNRTFKQVGFFADLLIFACGDSRILLDKHRNVFCEYITLHRTELLNGGKVNRR